MAPHCLLRNPYFAFSELGFGALRILNLGKKKHLLGLCLKNLNIIKYLLEYEHYGSPYPVGTCLDFCYPGVCCLLPFWPHRDGMWGAVSSVNWLDS